MAGGPGDARPGEQAQADDQGLAEPVGDEAGEGAGGGVGSLEPRQHVAPLLLVLDAGNITDDRPLHRGDELAIEIVEKGHRDEQCHGEPSSRHTQGGVLRVGSRHRLARLAAAAASRAQP